ncbi:putative mitochondrial hypothetical protein [Leptomonas pyrrhocoris]|uniref:Uncharacterized protein n=1 Tax=Leptomonas pyrrhocoris TaxID=157538 RepID=A0A0N0VH50_LEPPY|nr:putative mitochondrial hypothetical protein [Leptomonas pyrrhocoris]KPA85058.1 putative mitochondrial hypothetical protein [Leptomonas pyrrhocoris]|eukprot:XP_015663497.1 putative mitochondrial hypothetical protein [Leptomonas pyrrhocoris]
MHRRLRSLVAAQRSCHRFFSEFNSGSVLGTPVLSGSLLKDMQEDLKHENELHTRGMGETLQNFVNRAELTHMESPEADEKFMKNLESKVDDLFSRIPLPEDPMRAALALTDEEVKEEAAAELVKEAVREMYWRKLDAKKAEELRLKHAQEKYAKQGMRQYFDDLKENEKMRERYSSVLNGGATSTTTSRPCSREQDKTTSSTSAAVRGDEDGDVADATAEELRAELAAMKAKMAKLEEMLRAKK